MSRRTEDADGVFRSIDAPILTKPVVDLCLNCGKLLEGSGSADLFCSDDCRNENPDYIHSDFKLCAFCQIVAKAQPVEELIRHSGGVLSFTPRNPVTTGHRIFIPRRHVYDAAHYPSITGQVFAVASAYAAVAGSQFNLITSAGRFATQTIFHLHVHYVPRAEHDGLLLPWSEF